MNAKDVSRKCAVDNYTTAYRRSDGCATWRVMSKEIIGLFSSVPTLSRWRDCVPIQVSPLLKGQFRRWIAGKRYIPQQKSRRKDKSVVGCTPGAGKV